MICVGPKLRQFPINYIFNLVFTIVMAVMVGFISAMYTWQSVVLAAGATFMVFTLLTIYAFVTESDFTGFGPYLFAALNVLLAFSLIICIMSLFGAHIHWMIILYDIA